MFGISVLVYAFVPFDVPSHIVFLDMDPVVLVFVRETSRAIDLAAVIGCLKSAAAS
jgi:hypothetical protein